MFIDGLYKTGKKTNNTLRYILLFCLTVKPLIFYNLMDIRINIQFLWLATATIFVLFFASFKNVWIPFSIYTLITVLMFGDLVYNGYFNGYLSINAYGSVKYLPEVWGVIREVIRYEYWLIFWDLPVLWLAILKYKSTDKKARWLIRTTLVSIVLMLTLGSVSNSRTLQSIGNLEFLSAHITDSLAGYMIFAETYAADISVSSYRVDPENEGELFGVAEGRNLIVIQMEALQNFVINRQYEGDEITPVLNRLIKEDGTLYFDNYYMQIGAGNTSDAEFATNNSIYGTEKSYTYELYKDNTFRGLPFLLKEIGYTTIAMHGYEGSFWSRDEMYPSQGFDVFVDGDSYDPTVIHGWGILDEEFYMQSLEYLKAVKQPFYSFMVSLTNHTPFEIEDEYRRLNLSKEHTDTRFGNYLDSTAYSDYAVSILLDGLKESGLYENSIIAIYGDHFGLAQKDEDNEELMTEFLGKPYKFDEMAKIPLIIHVPGADINSTISIAGGQLDFLPTIAYLMGFTELDTIHIGQNLITAESGLVAQNRYAPKGSFITDEIAFLMSGDKVFENGQAWSLDTGEGISLQGLRGVSEKSASLITLSEMILSGDFIAKRYGSN
ncbi:MAG TPA: LTA synthase family protein [Anaerovoracaceae bacterium]|nr:LTA synthase family protein [Anaerovoracaceae bacterium]